MANWHFFSIFIIVYFSHPPDEIKSDRNRPRVIVMMQYTVAWYHMKLVIVFKQNFLFYLILKNIYYFL